MAGPEKATAAYCALGNPCDEVTDMTNLWDKLRVRDKRSHQSFAKRWEGTRARGRGWYILKTGLGFALIYAVVDFIWQWAEANGLTIFGNIPSDYFGHTFLRRVVKGYITGCIMGLILWKMMEREYLKQVNEAKVHGVAS